MSCSSNLAPPVRPVRKMGTKAASGAQRLVAGRDEPLLAGPHKGLRYLGVQPLPLLQDVHLRLGPWAHGR